MRRFRRSLKETALQTGVWSLFALTVAARTRMRRLGPEVPLRPRTIVVFNHTTDLDIPIVVLAKIPPPTWYLWPGRVNFVGRSDLFLRGFLGLRFPELGPLRPLLFPIGLHGVLRSLRIVPVGKSGPRLAAEWLHDAALALGEDEPMSKVLAPDWAAATERAGVVAGATLGEVQQWRYHALLEREAGPELLRPEVHRRLRMHEARGAHARFEEIAAPLRAGSPLFMAPEGELSPSGTLQPFRSGVYRLLQAVPEAQVQPVGITYDLLDGRRPSVFVRQGPPLIGLGRRPRRDSERVLREALDALHTVTLPQVTAGILFDVLDAGDDEIAVDELERRTREEAGRLARQGAVLDPALGAGGFVERFHRFLRDAEGRGLRVRDGCICLDAERMRRPIAAPADRLQNPLGYARNQLNRAPGRSLAAGAGEEALA